MNEEKVLIKACNAIKIRYFGFSYEIDSVFENYQQINVQLNPAIADFKGPKKREMIHPWIWYSRVQL